MGAAADGAGRNLNAFDISTRLNLNGGADRDNNLGDAPRERGPRGNTSVERIPSPPTALELIEADIARTEADILALQGQQSDASALVAAAGAAPPGQSFGVPFNPVSNPFVPQSLEFLTAGQFNPTTSPLERAEFTPGVVQKTEGKFERLPRGTPGRTASGDETFRPATSGSPLQNVLSDRSARRLGEAGRF